jgi:8-oxo-dGTP pyrophosphatase MutT (NUDIX family)
VTRGGQQRIPRPPRVRPGEPPPWHTLPVEQRRFTLDDIRAACAALPPPHRPPPAPGARAAAVLAPFFEEDGEARVILTKRPETMPSHQGEISFPGGKLHPDHDATLRDAALREAEEEIGLRPDDVEVVAELDSLATVASRFAITPFVGLIDCRPPLVANPAEVVAVIDVPVSELLDDAVFREEVWWFEAADRPMFFYELPGETVWGATARILTDFLAHLTQWRHS